MNAREGQPTGMRQEHVAFCPTGKSIRLGGT